MGRPYKEGVDYWNIDVDFFQDKKIRLLRSQFGVKGVYTTILLLNEIYRTSGYYKQWDEDDCLLMSDSSGVAGDCSPQLIADVVQGLLRRSFFDKGIFERFHVLTSAGIQRRFLFMVGNSRERIPIIQEYFLLDTSNREDVKEATLKKLAFYSISSKETPVSLGETPVSRQENPLKESKGTQRKGSDSTGEERKNPDTPAPLPFADNPVLQAAFDTWLRYKHERREDYKPTGLQSLIARIRKNAEQYGAEMVAEVIRDSMAQNYQGIIFDWLSQRQKREHQRGYASAPGRGYIPTTGEYNAGDMEFHL